jgi:hypothetical protein
MENINSVSRSSVVLQVGNRGIVLCEISRHLSPITVNSVLKHLPIQNIVHRIADNAVYIGTGLLLGSEKQRRFFSRGDIGFMTSNSSLSFFIKDSIGISMNPIGKVKSGLELLETIRPGETMTLKKPEPIS